MSLWFPATEELQAGCWFTWNFGGGTTVTAKVRDVHVVRRLWGLSTRKEYEVECWVVVEEPGTCYRFPKNRVYEDEFKSLKMHGFLRKPIVVTNLGKILRNPEAYE